MGIIVVVVVRLSCDAVSPFFRSQGAPGAINPARQVKHSNSNSSKSIPTIPGGACETSSNPNRSSSGRSRRRRDVLACRKRKTASEYWFGRMRLAHQYCDLVFGDITQYLSSCGWRQQYSRDMFTLLDRMS
jgi:hypothetical protein